MKQLLRLLCLMMTITLCAGAAAAEESILWPSDTAGWTMNSFKADSISVHDTEVLYIDGTWYASWTNQTLVFASDDLRSWNVVGIRPTGWYSEDVEKNWLTWAPCYIELRKPYVGADGVEYRYALFDALSEWSHQEARIRCFVFNDPAPTSVKSYYYVGDVMASGFYAMEQVEGPIITSYEQETGEGPARYYYVDGYDSFYSQEVANGWNAIDPDVLYDEEGRLWLAFGAWHGGIFITELDQTTLMPVSNKAEDYTRIGMHIFDQCYEGCNLFYHDGYYYMTVAYGDIKDTYNIRLARSESITGPYLDYNGNPMTEADGSIGTRLAGPYAFEGDPGFKGQGHCAWVENPDTGEIFLLSNARTAEQSVAKQMVRSVYWLESGWPVLSPVMATADTIRTPLNDNGDPIPGPAAAPAVQPIPAELIAGEYEIIVHERLKPQLAKQMTSKRIQLNAEGSVTGGYTGTWVQTGENTVILTFGGRETEMFVTVGYDWERGESSILVMSGLTAPGAATDKLAGTAVWLKQVPETVE